MANPYDTDIDDRSNGSVIQATWFNIIKSSLVDNGAVKHNKAGTTAPTANEDSADNYEPGSTWTDTTNDKFYVCLDASAGAAVWSQVSTLTGTETLTNKTLTTPAINGSNLNFGTASNTNRLYLPKDTTANLDLLTDTAGLLAYDTTVNQLNVNNGSGWKQVSLDDPVVLVARKASPSIASGTLLLGTAIYSLDVLNDSHSGYSTGTGKYTTPSAGYYIAHFHFRLTGTGSGGYVTGKLVHSAGTYTDVNIHTGLAQSNGVDVNVTAIFNVAASTDIYPQMESNFTSPSPGASNQNNYLMIHRIR